MVLGFVAEAVVLGDVCCDSLPDVLDLADWVLTEVAVVFYVLDNQSGLGKCCLSEIRLNALLRLVLLDGLTLPENVILGIEVPFVLPVLLLTYQNAAVSLDVKLFVLDTLLQRHVRGNYVLCSDVTDICNKTVAKVWILDLRLKLIVP